MKKTTATRKRTATRKPICSEADIQRAVTDLLVLDGWRAIRTDPTSDRARGKGFGEIGMPDYLYFRYFNYGYFEEYWGRDPSQGYNGDASCGLVNDGPLWIEFKAPGKIPSPHQLIWHAAERARGALVLVVDDIDKFTAWYATASGLCRSASLIAAKKGKKKNHGA